MPHKHTFILVVINLIFLTSSLKAQESPRSTIVDGWGTLIDPEGDAQVTTTNGAAQLKVPGAYRDLWPTEGHVNAPRILQTFAGDFSVQVKISSAITSENKKLADDVPSPQSPPFCAGSLIIWADENNFVRLDLASSTKQDVTGYFCYYHTFRNGKRVVHEYGRMQQNTPTHLWIARKNGTIYAAFRQDKEKTWRRLQTHRPALPDKVQVGISVLNTTDEPFAVTFEDFKINKLQ